MRLSSSTFYPSAARGNIEPFDIEANPAPAHAHAPARARSPQDFPARRRSPVPAGPPPNEPVPIPWTVSGTSAAGDAELNWMNVTIFVTAVGMIVAGAVLLSIGLRRGSGNTVDSRTYAELPSNCTDVGTINSNVTGVQEYTCKDVHFGPRGDYVGSGGFMVGMGSLCMVFVFCWTDGFWDESW